MALPISFIVAGTSTIRTMVASTKMAVARPRPNILMAGSSPSTKPRKTEIMISAADVITRAVLAMPRTTEASLSPVTAYSPRTRESRNTS